MVLKEIKNKVEFQFYSIPFSSHLTFESFDSYLYIRVNIWSRRLFRVFFAVSHLIDELRTKSNDFRPIIPKINYSILRATYWNQYPKRNDKKKETNSLAVNWNVSKQIAPEKQGKKKAAFDRQDSSASFTVFTIIDIIYCLFIL